MTMDYKTTTKNIQIHYLDRKQKIINQFLRMTMRYKFFLVFILQAHYYNRHYHKN